MRSAMQCTLSMLVFSCSLSTVRYVFHFERRFQADVMASLTRLASYTSLVYEFERQSCLS